MRTIFHLSFLGLTILIGPAPVAGQADTLEAVDQTIEDVSALSASLRKIETGLRQPSDFEHVYRVPGEDDRLMRIHGALHAVFPRSVYARDRKGLRPLIPNDTVFYVGPPGVDVRGYQTRFNASASARPSGRFDGRINLKLQPQLLGSVAVAPQDVMIRQEPSRPMAPRPVEARVDRTPTPVMPMIVSDATYRAQRLHTLMRRAVAANLAQRVGEE